MDKKKSLSVITAGVLSLAMCGTLVSNELFDTPEVEAVSEMSAIEMVNDMGSGWNLGNTLDAHSVTWLNPLTVNGLETAWGNPTTSASMISTIHDYGFETVRIPVTWYQFVDEDYNIDEDFIARVKQIVDWCQEESMYAIVDMHWDDCNVNSGKNWLGTADSDFTNVENKYKSIWTQVADYFADYDNKLVFESNNEPSISVDNLMKLNQDFVDIFRSSGGNNADRLLLISSPEANLDKACTSTFSMPDDPSNMQAVSVHYYYPSTFCVADKTSTWGYETTWGTDSDINTMVNNFEKLKSTYTDNGIPVILGEYGVLTNDEKDDASIKKFLRSVAEYSKSYDGMMGILWDSGNGGDMQYFDRKNLTFFDSEIGDMFIEINGSDYNPVELTWVETEITTDSKGIVAVNTNGATKVKLEATCDVPGSGTGAIGYWDNNANDGKGAWVQDTIYIRFDTDEDGNVTISQTWDNPDVPNLDSEGNETDEVNNYEEILHAGYFEIPSTADTSSVQIMYFYGGYSDDGDWITMTKDQYPTLTKAYIPGVATDVETTTTDADVTEPTVVTTTEQPEDTTIITSELPEEPDFENLYGYIFPLFDNGVASQWDNDGSLADAVPVTGNGDYTLTIEIPEDGAAESILFFALSSDLNSYQQNADEVEIFKDLTITVNSILVDGEEIEYSQSANALSTNDDGSTYRLSIYDEWSKRNIQDINPLVVNTSSVVVNFTIDGIVGSGEVSATEPTVTTIDTTETSESDETTETSEDVSLTEDTTVTSESGDNVPTVLGDVNCDGDVMGNDLLLLKKYVLGLDVTIPEQGMINADVTGDGSVMGNDLLLLKKFILGIVDSL